MGKKGLWTGSFRGCCAPGQCKSKCSAFPHRTLGSQSCGPQTLAKCSQSTPGSWPRGWTWQPPFHPYKCWECRKGRGGRENKGGERGGEEVGEGQGDAPHRRLSRLHRALRHFHLHARDDHNGAVQSEALLLRRHGRLGAAIASRTATRRRGAQLVLLCSQEVNLLLFWAAKTNDRRAGADCHCFHTAMRCFDLL